jgi:cytoskeleton protein RodZ
MPFDAWVEIRGPNGDVLGNTFVRARETYTVPAGYSYRVIRAAGQEEKPK